MIVLVLNYVALQNLKLTKIESIYPVFYLKRAECVPICIKYLVLL